MIKKLLFLLCFLAISNTIVYGQAPGDTCATAVSFTLPTLPGAGNATTTGTRTTFGRGNNIAAGTYCTNAIYGGGTDGVYSITVPVGGGNYTFAFANAGNTYKILSIHSGCAITNANCIGGFTTGTGTGGSTTLSLAAGTYYLVIDTWPSPNSANYTLNVTLNPPPTSYCTPAPTSVDGIGITNVSFSVVNNSTGAEAGNYGDYSAMVGVGTEGSALPINITYQTGYTYDTSIWVDWNDDFDFSDPGELVYTGTSLGANPTTLAASITIPVGASTSGLGTGLHRMRIGAMDFGPMTNPCYTGTYACFEDYTISVSIPSACTTPIAQPTGLVFGTVSNSTIDGSFSASVPAASNYLVLMNTTGTTPTAPVDGTSYAIGNTALGGTVVDNDVNLNFSATGLTANTTYYFFIYAFNEVGCTGGPIYNTASPLTGNTTTDFYCLPSSTDTAYYIDDFITTGAITNINHTGTGFSTNGYGNFTAINVEQFPGSDIDFTINFGGGTFETNIWVDWNNDGDFVDGGEKVYDSPAYTNPTVGSFTIPAVGGGSYRMRVRSDWLNSDPSSCGYDDDSETHDYTLIVTPLNCNDNPQNLTAVASTTTTATVSWNAPAPPPGNGYEYIISTDNTTSTPGGDITGTTTGTSINLTGLNVGTTYYVFVRSVCNAVDNGVWITVTFITGCADLDDTPNHCEMIIDEVGTDSFAITPFNPDPSFTLDCTTNTVDLATNAQMYETTSYDVIKIPYANINSLGATINNSTITNDDLWADDPTALGFPFCFYDNEYDYTLLGANSMITFDIDASGAPYFMNGNNTPGTSCGYAFSDDLPSTNNSLFEQTIYGVYHDIDPRGLPANAITTRTQGIAGCRLFIAEWNDIPMYSDPSTLYSGKIVLYETTNIIEVYIEEKRLENNGGTIWNDGNAIVGVQGDITPLGPNNEYAVAPCRNGLDTNWEATNEAWRFVPSGNSRLTGVEWYIGTDTSGAPDATTNTYTATSPGTYTAISTYTTCGGSTVTLTDQVVVTGGNTWTSAAGTSDWNTAANWSNNTVPTDSDVVIIPDVSSTSGRFPIIQGGAPPASLAGCLTIQHNGYLEILNDGRLIVTGSITVEESLVLTDGTLLIRSGGNLIQITEGAVNTNNNTGSIKMQRSVTGVAYDSYVYWSSPVEAFNVQSVSPGTSGYIYEWIPTTGSVYGNWVNPGNAVMSQGKGYIIRNILGTTPEGGTVTPPATTAEFIGIPRNGELTTTINRGNHLSGNYPGAGNTLATPLDDNWNLIGNPYPSSISADAFITENATAITSTTPSISGTIWLWRHENTTSIINDPFYGNYYYNYDGNQYAAYNLSGPNPSGFNGNIASGQGFFVLMEDLPGPTLSTNITFNNSMRYFTNLGNNEAYDNNSFLRTASSESNTIERHRIWLDLIKPNNNATSILVGYIENATNTFDQLYDGYDLNSHGTRLYSIQEEKEFSIQGRVLPFDQEDIVPLGIVLTENGNHQIAINTLDGLFENESQDIYLEDTYTNTIHDLRQSTYSFTSEIGTFNDRFLLRYTDDALSIKDLKLNNGLTIKAPKGDYIKINSEQSLIESVIVYDLLGKILFNKNNINESELVINSNMLSDGTYIVKATLVNGKTKAQKIVLKTRNK